MSMGVGLLAKPFWFSQKPVSACYADRLRFRLHVFFRISLQNHCFEHSVRFNVHHIKKKKTKLDTDSALFTKINLKWIPDLNEKYTTENPPEYSIQENL